LQREIGRHDGVDETDGADRRIALSRHEKSQPRAAETRSEQRDLFILLLVGESDGTADVLGRVVEYGIGPVIHGAQLGKEEVIALL
jgi:hypothetical protein